MIEGEERDIYEDDEDYPNNEEVEEVTEKINTKKLFLK
jgi:hypothetical protein